VLQKKRSVVQVREERDLEGETLSEQEIEPVLVGHERDDQGQVRQQDQGKNRREQERDAVVVGHEREEVQGDDRGEVQGERPGTATTTGRHRRSGWDPIWVDISRFKPWLYHIQSQGDYLT